MAIECGIVGLPNVGKSTLFNTLTSANVAAENFPFCTVDPHRGMVEVPDVRLEKVAKIARSQKMIPTYMSFVDIAGLVKGASEGEGLGNQFLSNVREVDAILHVVRCFDTENITHVMGSVDPKRDVETIDLELCMADLELGKRRLEKLEKQAKGGDKEAIADKGKLENLMQDLEEGIPLRRRDDLAELRERFSFFITLKPLMYVANIGEEDVKEPSASVRERLDTLKQLASKDQARMVSLSASLEYQINELEEDARSEFFEEYQLSEPGLYRLIRSAYSLLGLISFFTAGPKEARAWSLSQGATAVEAAGKIHSDMARGFIRAEVISYQDYVSCGGEKGAKEGGRLRLEGKEYQVQDGDVVLFRFNV